MKRVELELAEAQLEANSTRHDNGNVTSGKTIMKLAPYKDNEDVSVYLRTFVKVSDCNGWSENVAISALMNGFTNTKVSLFLDTLSADVSYLQMKELFVRSFGFTVYDYQHRFRNARQSGESFSHNLFCI